MPGEDTYKDLIGFLNSDRADLRIAATEAVNQVTDPSAITSLIRHGIVAPLCRLSSRSNEASGLNALQALVHFSSEGTNIHQCVEDILDNGGINRMTEIALSPASSDTNDHTWRKRINYALALLANLTRTERGAIELCGRTMPDEAIPTSLLKQSDTFTEKLPSKPTLALLSAMFLHHGHIKNVKEMKHKENDLEESIHDLDIEKIAASCHDPFQHFSLVLMNVTQVEQGRRFVMKLHSNDDKVKGISMLQRVLPELKSGNPIRRRGIAGVAKNCCTETDSSWWLINEVNIIPKILYPLAGPEELDMDEKKGMDPDLWLEGPDKVREPDQVTRLLLVESILLLCASGRMSRQSVRLQRTYVILKIMDLSEESEEISERISDCVNYLRRDEEGEAEGSSDRFVSETLGLDKLPTLPSTSACSQISVGAEDYDEID